MSDDILESIKFLHDDDAIAYNILEYNIPLILQHNSTTSFFTKVILLAMGYHEIAILMRLL